MLNSSHNSFNFCNRCNVGLLTHRRHKGYTIAEKPFAIPGVCATRPTAATPSEDSGEHDYRDSEASVDLLHYKCDVATAHCIPCADDHDDPLLRFQRLQRAVRLTDQLPPLRHEKQRSMRLADVNVGPGWMATSGVNGDTPLHMPIDLENAFLDVSQMRGNIAAFTKD